jgi:hypothetical protein
VRESQRRRFADVGLVDKVVQLDNDWRAGECHCSIDSPPPPPPLPLARARPRREPAA